MDIDEEAEHHDHVLRSFTAYRYHHLAANNLRRQAYMSLSSDHQKLLPNQLKLLNELDHCITNNAEFLEDIAAHGHENTFLEQSSSKSNPKPKPKVTGNELEKTRSVLRQMHRDWSAEGQAEREQAYKPILDALETQYSEVSPEDRKKIRVLVPGCGLGRLPFEIAHRGFSTQGNEFSMFMLFAANFILNSSTAAEEFSIHPFCHSLSNIRKEEDAFREVRIPDVLPSELVGAADFSMAAGDFCEIYADDHEQWDCVVTCFFIDTARNIVQYIEQIARLLKKGGIWINLGPSLWHFEGNSSGSIDLPLSEVKALANRLGFTLRDEREVKAAYTANPDSTMQYTYDASFWIAELR